MKKRGMRRKTGLKKIVQDTNYRQTEMRAEETLQGEEPKIAQSQAEASFGKTGTF